MQIEKLDLNWKYRLIPIRKVNKIVCHHPAHPTWTAYDIHEYHKNGRGWNGAGYNYFVTKDGRVQELRGRSVGAHVKGRNSDTIGVSFQGNFDDENMTDEQVTAGAWLISKIIRDDGLSISDVIGHKDLSNTSCPGANFRMNDLRQEILLNLNPSVAKEKKEVPSWKVEGIKWMYEEGLLTTDDWKKRMDEPLPLWALAIVLKRMNEGR